MKKCSPENLVEKWLDANGPEHRRFLERRPMWISYVLRLAKGLNGWKTAKEIVKDWEGSSACEGRADIQLRELSRWTDLVRMAYGEEDIYFAWVGEEIPKGCFRHVCSVPDPKELARRKEEGGN